MPRRRQVLLLGMLVFSLAKRVGGSTRMLRYYLGGTT